MTITENCESCDWSGPSMKLKQRKETDHEVWLTFHCPQCSYEISRVNQARLRSDTATLKRGVY